MKKKLDKILFGKAIGRKNRRGFTLVECVMALFLFVVMASMVMSILLASVQQKRLNDQYEKALNQSAVQNVKTGNATLSSFTSAIPTVTNIATFSFVAGTQPAPSATTTARFRIQQKQTITSIASDSDARSVEAGTIWQPSQASISSLG
ncbi:MAG: prepilin-type N-terminal cleavage/methylation domain-containing protein [Oscillospiraceae bacterium]|jgi:prepilin-type N-terminal cleavage/methylation domain-containing protein|nr:prepilin-type N-terminal cleavage/methylation domain-containing protein [Oscillospiraceae bacterium]